ncbi:MBOAT family protein [Butyrivibrio sp. CB08]|uniref:MBOAT family O-acyltransferase n=1 Tax=Butyrivibrio sp. CB08 TaxID=2364879 RepID=UPI000EA8C599|nr:MBOAT family O-acyltransferase [Butyrivibrio sp. CB08]RKM57837.1 MBOAT family protein [Butyrivibrio sp. CB08]
MTFNSFGFILLLLPLFIVAMQLTKRITIGKPRYREACKVVIIAFSLAFYAPFGVKNIAVLAASILINAVGARFLFGKRNKAFLAVLLAVNVGALLFFKFNGFFFPVAVSFYTFNQISYIVDIYRGDAPEFSLPDYLAYILFFPKILQGPLMGYGKFVEKLDKALETGDAGGRVKAVDYEMALRAMLLLSMGLFKKVILADTFGRAVDYGYDNLMTLGSMEAILVAVFYSIQLYFDFSGYCDMAAAVCMMIGFDLPENFNSPYKAVNIVDFWKRWHISLTRFFTKYVYIPLGGNRKGAMRMYINFMIVFLLSGLWHGSGWTFIVWGAMHGVLYVITRAVSAGAVAGIDVKKESVIGRGVKVLLTFIYVTVAWVFFRANTISDAVTLLTRVFTGGAKRISTGISACFQLDELWYIIKVTPLMKMGFVWEICLWLFLLVSVAVIFFSRNAIEIAKTCRIGVKTTVFTAVLLVWSIVSFAGVSTFLYMNF